MGTTNEELAVALARVEERLIAQGQQIETVLEHQKKHNGILDNIVVWQPVVEQRLKRLEELDATGRCEESKETGEISTLKLILPWILQTFRWLIVAVAAGGAIAFGYNLLQNVNLFK